MGVFVPSLSSDAPPRCSVIDCGRMEGLQAGDLCPQPSMLTRTCLLTMTPRSSDGAPDGNQVCQVSDGCYDSLVTGCGHVRTQHHTTPRHTTAIIMSDCLSTRCTCSGSIRLIRVIRLTFHIHRDGPFHCGTKGIPRCWTLLSKDGRKKKRRRTKRASSPALRVAIRATATVRNTTTAMPPMATTATPPMVAAAAERQQLQRGLKRRSVREKATKMPPWLLRLHRNTPRRTGLQIQLQTQKQNRLLRLPQPTLRTA